MFLLALFAATGPALAQDEAKMYLAEVSSSPTLRIVDADTGLESASVPLGVPSPTDFATSPAGTLYATTFTTLYQVDSQTGAAQSNGSLGFSSVVGLEFDCSGGAFLVTADGEFARIDDLTTAETTLIEDFNDQFSGDVATLGQAELYATVTEAGESKLVRLDLTTTGATMTDLGVPVPGAKLFGLDFDGNGRLIGSDDGTPCQLYEIVGWAGVGPVGAVPLATISSPQSGQIAGIASVIATGQQVEYGTASMNSCGTMPNLSATGIASASAPSGFMVTGTNLAGRRPAGLLLSANGRANTPFGAGTLYLQSPHIVRVRWTSGTSGQCDGQVSFDLNALAGPTFLDQPGTLVQCQIISRDIGPPSSRRHWSSPSASKGRIRGDAGVPGVGRVMASETNTSRRLRSLPRLHEGRAGSLLDPRAWPGQCRGEAATTVR